MSYSFRILLDIFNLKIDEILPYLQKIEMANHRISWLSLVSFGQKNQIFIKIHVKFNPDDTEFWVKEIDSSPIKHSNDIYLPKLLITSPKMLGIIKIRSGTWMIENHPLKLEVDSYSEQSPTIIWSRNIIEFQENMRTAYYQSVFQIHFENRNYLALLPNEIFVELMKYLPKPGRWKYM